MAEPPSMRRYLQAGSAMIRALRDSRWWWENSYLQNKIYKYRTSNRKNMPCEWNNRTSICCRLLEEGTRLRVQTEKLKTQCKMQRNGKANSWICYYGSKTTSCQPEGTEEKLSKKLDNISHDRKSSFQNAPKSNRLQKCMCVRNNVARSELQSHNALALK